MLRRFIGITGISAWVVLIVIMVMLSFQAKVNGEPMFENLPEGWRVEQSFMAPLYQRMAIGNKLGGIIIKLNNTVLSYDGKILQVNVLDAATESAAERIYQSILKAHNNDPLYALRSGKRVIEFAKTDDAELVKKARVAMGLDKEVPPVGQENEDDVKLGLFDDLPEGWRVEQSFMAPLYQRMAIGNKLGGIIIKLNNTVLSYDGKSLQVNVLDAATESAAERIYQSILKAHNNDPLYALRSGKRVIEFAKTDDAELVKKARVALGLDKEVPPVGQENEDDVKLGLFDDLPYGWELKDTTIVSPERTAALARKYGGEITTLTRNILLAHGKELTINVMECPSKKDAKKIHRYFLETQSHPALAASKGNTVVEYVTEDVNLALKTTWELGIRRKFKRAKYRVIIYAAPIAEGDYTVWQRYVSLFSKVGNDTPDPKIVSEIAELSKKFKFADTITLRSSGESKNRAMYKIKPAPDSNEILADGDIIRYTFANLPKKLDVPWFKMAALLTGTAEAFTASERKADEQLLGATKFWPVDDPQIKELAQQITEGKKSPEEKVRAILEWLKPGKNIRLSGTGSVRHGVKKVLEQGSGHDWDFSDCFVTLCRASGVGCRQVAGWYFGAGEHIWAEVLYESKGFQQVDPTWGGQVDCGIYHIAYLSSEDGSMPMIYLDKPAVIYLYMQN